MYIPISSLTFLVNSSVSFIVEEKKRANELTYLSQ